MRKDFWVTGVVSSVSFSGTVYHSFTTSSQGGGGTVTVVGTSATFFARAVVLGGGAAVTCNISRAGNSRTATRSTVGTTDSTSFTLAPGMYSYSYSLVINTPGQVGGGIAFTQ